MNIVARSEDTPDVKPDVTPGSQRRWSREPVDASHVHVKLVDYAKALLRNSESRHSKNRARERIYEGFELLNNRAAIVSLEAAGIGIARLNATKSIIDTFVSRLAKERPMPQFDVEDDWQRKRQARRFRQFTVGQMRETQFDDLSRDALLDASIIGDGFTRVDSDDDVFAERIPANEILFDARECKYGNPQQAVRIYRVAKDYLAEIYPKFATEIRLAPASQRRKDDEDSDLIGNLDDYMDVYEAWQLPATKDSKDGRHFVGGENVTFVFEEWLEPRFPWGHMRVFKPRRGLHGIGFVDQLASLQHRVNCIVRDLQLNLAATGRGFFAVNEANDVPVEALTGWQPFKLKFKGNQPPTWVAPQPFNQAQLNALEYFINKMYDLTGVSQAAATSKSALGPGASGVALDTQYDIDSDRFRMPQANYAQYRLDCSQRFVDAAARVARRREKMKGEKKSYVAVSWKARDAIEKLEYDKVSLKEGQYCLRIEAVNFIPDTRAGKLTVVEQLAKAGVIPQWLVPTLFDEPDIVAANGIILAPFRAAMKKMEDILPEEDEPMPVPQPHNDLELELKLCVAYLNRLEEEKNVPLVIFERYDQYRKLLIHEISLRASPAPALDGAVQPGEMGGPAPVAPPMPAGPVPVPAPAPAPMPAPAMPPGTLPIQ